MKKEETRIEKTYTRRKVDRRVHTETNLNYVIFNISILFEWIENIDFKNLIIFDIGIPTLLFLACGLMVFFISFQILKNIEKLKKKNHIVVILTGILLLLVSLDIFLIVVVLHAVTNPANFIVCFAYKSVMQFITYIGIILYYYQCK